MAEFGEILKAIGDFGFFQKLILLALTFPNLMLPILFSCLIFIQSDPDRHCNTDWILGADPNLTADEQLDLTVPRQEDGSFSKCLMFVPVKWDIIAIREYGLNATTQCLHGWVYDKTLYEATIITDFDLVCDKSNLVEVAQTVFMAGILSGSFIFGPMVESYGRKRTTQLPAVFLLIFTILSGVSVNLYMFLVTQFFVGAAIGGFRINSTLLATEWIGVTQRSFSSCLGQLFAGVGQCVMAGLVYICRDWRNAQYVMAGVLAFISIYICFIPESARWLLGQGRTQEANKLIMKAAAINKRKIPENLLDEVTEKKEIQRGGIQTILKSPVLVKYVFIVSLAWFSLNLGYFCLVLNVAKFGMNVFLVQILFGVTEIPAHLLCIWFLELVGRKISLIVTLLAGGVVCFLSLAVPQGNAIAFTTIVTIGKFFLTWAGSVCMVYIQELFPTCVRQTAFGLGSISFRIAGLLAPMVNMLAMYSWFIPITVFSSLSLISGALCFLLPETRRTELPDSTDEGKGKRNEATETTTRDSEMAEHNVQRSTKL
ncbi:solute carrier family 22 member 13 [Genypterus blacodes]|uniref:solute carrier family 22 member 13 n=1 Tax=Genypterus blacodes TaxID=154954 RepID=UPI003F766D9F